MSVIVTFAEQRDGRLRRASLETLSEARRLADAMGGRVETLLAGKGVAGLADELGRHGADVVHLADHEALAAYATESYARALAGLVEELKPAAVLVPFTAMGKDLAPRVAARVGAGLASDVGGLVVKAGRLQARPAARLV